MKTEPSWSTPNAESPQPKVPVRSTRVEVADARRAAESRIIAARDDSWHWRPKCRCVFCCLWLFLCCAAAGCSFLANEFTWLDRAGPAVQAATDATATGTVSRP
ncbi:MAG TPA: hypothetical protein VFD82_20245 [Planctomycetota bacterium]|nr:hypothetical protein [Planctomycetota bacterium]